MHFTINTIRTYPLNLTFLAKIVGMTICIFLASEISMYAQSSDSLFIHTDSLSKRKVPTLIMPSSVHFKNTPEALEVASQLIKRKYQQTLNEKENYSFDMYDKILFAWNNFDSQQKIVNRWSFFDQYKDTTLSTSTSILPLALYESVTTVYSRNHGKDIRAKKIGTSFNGFIDLFQAEKLSMKIANTLGKIDFKENTCKIFFNKIISPLSSRHGTSFYRWNIMDTVAIDGKQYQILSFRPASILETGFSGNIYVSTDGEYRLKRIVIKLSKDLNFNYLENFVIWQDFSPIPNEPEVWSPTHISMVCTASFFGIVKSYCEWKRLYSTFSFDNSIANLPIFETPPSEVKLEDTINKDNNFWHPYRSQYITQHQHEYQCDSIKQLVLQIPTIRFAKNSAEILSTRFFPLTRDLSKNKLNIGSLNSFYSANSIEGQRLRIDLQTTAHLHPHLFWEAYAAYGFKDSKIKYSLKASWAFNKPAYSLKTHPQNNLSVLHQYDLNTVGDNALYQRYSNILSSILRYRRLDRMTYATRSMLAYKYEAPIGLSFEFLIKIQNEKPAGALQFQKRTPQGNIVLDHSLSTTEISSIIRYTAQKRLFIQNSPVFTPADEKFITSIILTRGVKNLLRGEFNYNKIQLHLIKEWWFASFGKLNTSIRSEWMWGSVPYPILFSPSINNSYLIQRDNFDLMNPLEFVNSRQLSWDIDYDMRGVLFRRIPVIKKLRIREHLGFSGIWGTLNNNTKPENNYNLYLFPPETRSMNAKTPYLEYNIGLSNILKVLRVSYVRRLTYLQEPNIKKSGLRVSFKLRF